MPEGRMLKKKISESKKLAALKSDSARLLYTWLIPHLDVEGRHLADPEVIKGHVFPKIKSMTPKKIYNLLIELYGIGLIILYKEDSEFYLQLIKFQDYQSINPDREAKSTIPAPTEKNRFTLENSGVNPENSMLSKVNKSKVNGSKAHSENAQLFEKAFEQLWEIWPIKKDKERSRQKFLARCKEGKLEEIQKAVKGYSNFLKKKRIEEDFDQAPMYLSTFLEKNRWTEYLDEKYQPKL